MPAVPKRMQTNLDSPYDKNDVIGFFTLYALVAFIIPYLLFKYASFELFITYFANVDIVANILSVNFPDFFVKWYSVYNDSLRGYLSFNIISVIALSGIFYFGIKDVKRTPNERWVIMIIMSIITWTLPTAGIPFMNEKIEEYLINTDDITEDQYSSYRLFITIAISFLFLQTEWLLIGYIERLKL